MTLFELSHLTDTEQLDLLYKEGVFLCKRQSENKTVILYQFRHLYVEIYYSLYRQVVDQIIYSEEIQILDPYLDRIMVDEIFFRNN